MHRPWHVPNSLLWAEKSTESTQRLHLNLGFASFKAHIWRAVMSWPCAKNCQNSPEGRFKRTLLLAHLRSEPRVHSLVSFDFLGIETVRVNTLGRTQFRVPEVISQRKWTMMRVFTLSSNGTCCAWIIHSSFYVLNSTTSGWALYFRSAARKIYLRQFAVFSPLLLIIFYGSTEHLASLLHWSHTRLSDSLYRFFFFKEETYKYSHTAIGYHASVTPSQERRWPRVSPTTQPHWRS